jgi:hypothetical protein
MSRGAHQPTEAAEGLHPAVCLPVCIDMRILSFNGLSEEEARRPLAAIDVQGLLACYGSHDGVVGRGRPGRGGHSRASLSMERPIRASARLRP